MIHQRIEVYAQTGAYMDTYLLSDSNQIQIGKTRPAIIICPGGAYLRTSDQEAEQVALHFNTLGCHAAVLRYSCLEAARMPNPMIELANAIRCFRENAQAWFVKPNQIAVCGFSAGGHLSAMLSTASARLADDMGVDAELIRPNAAILAYPCTELSGEATIFASIDDFLMGEIDPAHPEDSIIPLYRCALCEKDGELRMDFNRAMRHYLFGDAQPSQDILDAYSPVRLVDANTPPSFVWTTANDNLVPASHSIHYVDALWKNGVPCEFHLFADGHHGLSLADHTVADNQTMQNPEVAAWFSLVAAWLKKLWGLNKT